MRRHPTLVAIVALALPGLVLAPVWRIGGLGAGEDDILYYFPSRVWFHEMASQNHPPWLNPWNGLDRPYLADPQSAVFYPTTWLFARLPPIVAYAVSLWLHYSLALLGMYRLLRAETLDRTASAFGAIAFAFCGFLLAHRAHFTMQHAAAWAPLVFWRVGRFAMHGGAGRLVIAGAVAAAQCFAGHVQMAALTALGTLVYLLAAAPWGTGSSSQAAPSTAAGGRALRCLACWLLAVGLFSIQLVPTLLLLGDSTRTSRGYLDFCENSWLPISAVGWIMPMLLGQRTPNVFDQPYWAPSHQVEQFSYIGLMPLALAAATIRSGWRDDPRRRGWAVLGLFALLTALGLYGPICPILYWIPGASVFRVPARAILLASLAAAVLAAWALHDLGASPTPRRARLRLVLLDWTGPAARRIAGLFLVPLVVIVVTAPFLPAETRAAALAAARPDNPAVWVPLVVLAITLATLRIIARRWQEPRWRAAATFILIADLAVIGWTIDVPAGARRPDDVLRSPVREAWIDPVCSSTQRLWVVTRRSPARPAEYDDPLGKCASNTNILDRVAALTDYGPLTPHAFARVFDFKPWGEPVDPDRRLRDPRWMQRFNLRWLLLCAADLPPPPEAQSVVTAGDSYRLYDYPHARGMAYFDDATQPGVVRYRPTAPHRFTVVADPWPAAPPADDANPPRVIVARLALPGWRATCDGDILPIEHGDEALLSVRLPRSSLCIIEWEYSPPGLEVGAAISLITAVGAAGFYVASRRSAAPPAGLDAHA